MSTDSTEKTKRWRAGVLLSTLAATIVSSGAMAAKQDSSASDKGVAPPTLEETRLILEKWINIQQSISKERNEWQQGKEILTSRTEIVKREIAGLEEKIKQAESSVAETNAKRDELVAEGAQLKATFDQLGSAVTGLENEVRRLFKSIPEPLQTKLQKLRQRMPEDAANAHVTVGERFQNVLGILNELNQANTEIATTYEVRNLADGKPAEVRVMYVGLAQAYYVSANGEAGIGRPGPDGWKWEPSKAVAGDVLTALEIVQGKHTPAFVPLPVKLQ